MKTKMVCIIIFMTGLISVSGQNITPDYVTKPHNNELGIDITNLIKQFLNFNSGNFSRYYQPTYYIFYRRHFKNFNIRFKAGGSYSYTTNDAWWATDPLRSYVFTTSEYDLSVGCEFFSEISEKWKVFYGLDFRPSYAKSYNDAQYWNGGYSHGYDSKTTTYAFSPLLGMQFSPKPRLHVLTELSASYLIQKNHSKVLQHPIDPMYPVLPDPEPKDNKYIYFNFSEPLFLIVSFDI